MHGIWRDLLYGVRGLRKQPGFTLLAVLALALGIGAATTLFSVIQNVLLDPFPYKGADRVVTFYVHDVKDPGPYWRSFFHPAELLAYQQRAADQFRAYALDRADPRLSQMSFQFQARLKPGRTPRDVEADINVIAHALAKEYPARYPQQFTVRAESWVDSIVGQFKTTLL